jgi:hypothetical protein
VYEQYVNDTVKFIKTPKGMAICLILAAVLFNAVALFVEVSVSTYELNDEAMHLTAAEGANTALDHFSDPTDFWLPQIDLGYPLFHYYQSLPHVIPAILSFLTAGLVSATRFADLFRYLLLVLFPVSMYIAMRRFGFDYLAAGISGFVASVLSTTGLFGIEYGSYLWYGFGLYSQLWAMFFLPLALAECYRVIKGEGSWFWAVLLSAIVLLSNLIYGYMLIVTITLFIIITPNLYEITTRLKKAVVFYVMTAAVTAYFFIPCILDINYYNRSIWLDPLKYNSLGAVQILTNLVTGSIFDYGRFAVLTTFFFIGVILIAIKWKEEKYRLLLLVTFFWLLLYFGQPTWGDLLTNLPFGKDLHFHRFVGMFQIGAVMIIGVGLMELWGWVKKIPTKIPVQKLAIAAGLIFLIVMVPVYMERAQSYQYNTQWKTQSQQIFQSKSAELTDIKNTVNSLQPGRTYAGMPADFGKTPAYVMGFVPMYSVLPQLGLDTFGYAYTAFPLVSDIRLGFDNTKIEQYDLFNIRYVLLHNTWTPASYYVKIKQFEDYTLYQVPTTGYFDLVDVPAVIYGNTSSFYYPNAVWFSTPLVAQKQNPIVIITDTKPNTSLGLPEYSYAEVTGQSLMALSQVRPSAGTLTNETVGNNKYSVQATVNRDCYIMLKTSYHPGWTVTIDGKNIDTVMVSPGYLAAKITPGTHQVTATYSPPGYRSILLLAGIILLAAIFFRKELYKRLMPYIQKKP